MPRGRAPPDHGGAARRARVAALEARLERLLGTPRLLPAPAPPPPSPDPARVRAVHWNLEHGNEYAQVERALLTHAELRDADLVLLNEVDLGMARSGNRDVAADLARALGLHGVFAALFLELTPGRDDDLRFAARRENQESLFGVAILSRWPIVAARLVDLPSPEHVQFDVERMVGRHIGLVAEIARPGAPFVAASAHLEVHRTRAHRAAQVRVLTAALRDESRPVILAGDFNSHTFDRGLWHAPLAGALALIPRRAERCGAGCCIPTRARRASRCSTSCAARASSGRRSRTASPRCACASTGWTRCARSSARRTTLARRSWPGPSVARDCGSTGSLGAAGTRPRLHRAGPRRPRPRQRSRADRGGVRVL